MRINIFAVLVALMTLSIVPTVNADRMSAIGKAVINHTDDAARAAMRAAEREAATQAAERLAKQQLQAITPPKPTIQPLKPVFTNSAQKAETSALTTQSQKLNKPIVQLEPLNVNTLKQAEQKATQEAAEQANKRAAQQQAEQKRIADQAKAAQAQQIKQAELEKARLAEAQQQAKIAEDAKRAEQNAIRAKASTDQAAKKVVDKKPLSQEVKPTPSVAKGAGKADSAQDFVVSPGGTAFPVPKGATGPTPVVNPAGKKTGDAFTGGSGGANGQVDTMRMMDPTPPRGNSPGYPNGYIKYENKAGQGVDPYTGRTLSNKDSHFPID